MEDFQIRWLRIYRNVAKIFCMEKVARVTEKHRNADKEKHNYIIDLRSQFCLIIVLIAIEFFLKPLRRILKACIRICDLEEILAVIELVQFIIIFM